MARRKGKRTAQVHSAFKENVKPIKSVYEGKGEDTSKLEQARAEYFANLRKISRQFTKFENEPGFDVERNILDYNAYYRVKKVRDLGLSREDLAAGRYFYFIGEQVYRTILDMIAEAEKMVATPQARHSRWVSHLLEREIAQFGLAKTMRAIGSQPELSIYLAQATIYHSDDRECEEHLFDLASLIESAMPTVEQAKEIEEITEETQYDEWDSGFVDAEDVQWENPFV